MLVGYWNIYGSYVPIKSIENIQRHKGIRVRIEINKINNSFTNICLLICSSFQNEGFNPYPSLSTQSNHILWLKSSK